MKFQYPRIAALLTGSVICQTSTAQDLMRSLDPLLVKSDAANRALSATELMIGPDYFRHADTAAIVGKMPGAAIVRNGSQTGILQLRGLSGDRVAVRVDGMTITPACPNHMDPPLHYAHPAGGDVIELMAGISPVSAGGDHIGGSISVKSAEPQFSAEGELLTKGALGASYRGSQDAVSLAADLSFANESTAFRYRGSAATAGNLRYPGGAVSASGYDTTSHDLTAAWRAADATLSMTTAAADTELTPSGTRNIPPLGAHASACAAMW